MTAKPHSAGKALSASHAPEGRIAIIDIGSNSIRLVVYDQQKRSPISVYNEKVMCALGRGLATSGVLNPEGVVMAKEALRRFIAMSHNMGIATLHVMATAAVRDASDGKAFVGWLEEAHGVNVDIITGEEEARLGAFAVCATMHHPRGITADLGGGSLELVRVDEGRIGQHESLPLGSLRMLDEARGDRDKLRKMIDKRFDSLGWLQSEPTPNIYAIGGSFRALAKMHLTAQDYPIKILHEYTIEAKEFLTFLREVITLSPDKLEKYPGSAKARVPALPGAAMVLEAILLHSKAPQLVISASGIREGYLFNKLSDSQRHEDDLIVSCREFASRSGRNSAYADELFKWMEPVIDHEDEDTRRLRFAFCLLSDIAIHIHPEYRAPWAFQRVVYAAFTSLTHRERATLALALYHRYQFKLKDGFPALALVGHRERAWAKVVGSAANLAYHLSGSCAGNLPRTALDVRDGHVVLRFAEGMADVMGEAVQKRIDGLDEAYRVMYVL
jgi:exopolyphosphatase / guanosine-5'-triphosphate,3'-diphosphate pyrophosphatase